MNIVVHKAGDVTGQVSLPNIPSPPIDVVFRKDDEGTWANAYPVQFDQLPVLMNQKTFINTVSLVFEGNQIVMNLDPHELEMDEGLRFEVGQMRFVIQVV